MPPIIPTRLATVISGANGAGKTTLARQLLPLSRLGRDFLNVDEIQRANTPPLTDVAAGREFLTRLTEVEVELRSFGLETTLSSRSYAPRIRRWKALGYHVVVHFIELPSADVAVQRVAQRVAAGGHDVPEADVRRRFQRGRALFFALYQSLASEYFHWLSDDHGLRLVEHRKNP